jgi:hypothetical protein
MRIEVENAKMGGKPPLYARCNRNTMASWPRNLLEIFNS